MPTKRKILVTAALPYANGDIHLGHLLEHIQADIWVRFQKMRGHECYFVCADDTHGTAVMLAAQQKKITPEKLIEQVNAAHRADLGSFHVQYDHYGSTHSPENQQFAEAIYLALQRNDKIVKRTVEQFFDPERQIFLSDRFVKGTCPNCAASDQYGDNCEQCGATYASTELSNPYSTLSSAKPELQSSEHCFFKLSQCTDFLNDWISGTCPTTTNKKQTRLQTQSRNKMKEWIKQGLIDWDISRDAPYFGFQIPGEINKYFYVWLDAPIGYLASFKQLCDRLHLDFDTWFCADSATELYHFIGKDILYFHALFWPAVLASAGYRTPSGVLAHGFLTVNGQKMSKSRGTFITAQSYLKQHLNPEWLRYYMAAKLNAHVEDMDLSLNDLMLRVNSDLIGKFINIASRSTTFLGRYFNYQLSAPCPNDVLLHTLQSASETIADAYEAREYSKALRIVMALADQVNSYVDQHQPWVLAKQTAQQGALHEVCTILINAFRLLTIYLKPVLPDTAKQIEGFLNCPALTWQSVPQLLPTHHVIQPYQHIMQRVEWAQLEQLTQVNGSTMSTQTITPDTTITLSDFEKLDLRVGMVQHCQAVEGSDKLLQLTVNIGSTQRNIFSGIKQAYPDPQQLIGRKVIVIANLAPRTMRFGISEGMVLCASAPDDTNQLFLLDVDQGATPGMQIS